MKTAFDLVEALMHELSVGEQLALVDLNNRPAIKQFLLGLGPTCTLISTITVQPVLHFVATDHFKVATKKEAPVRISYIGDNFKELFFGKTEERTNASEVNLHYYALNKDSLDTAIITELGGETKIEITLAEVFALMKKQSNGEKGALLTTGCANIFYVRDTNSTLRAVNVYWDGGGWSVEAYSVEHPDEWHAGYQVFSRDS